MAYNPGIYNTYGNMYGNAYGGSYAQAQYQQPQMQQQTYTPPQMPQGIIWVDGEVGAKAYQMPAGWPVNTPIPLWDTNDTIIYLKSTNQMGMPNPLQTIHYKLDEQTQRYPARSSAMTPALTSGAAGDDGDYVRREELITEGYVKKEDLDRMKKELMDSIGQQNAPRRTAKGE